jgi:hypothetical protein
VRSLELFFKKLSAAFGIGLVLGAFIQLIIPPRDTWKMQLLIFIPIAIIGGIVMALYG